MIVYEFLKLCKSRKNNTFKQTLSKKRKRLLFYSELCLYLTGGAWLRPWPGAGQLWPRWMASAVERWSARFGQEKGAHEQLLCSRLASLLLEGLVLMEPWPYWTLARFVHDELISICLYLLSNKGSNKLDFVVALCMLSESIQSLEYSPTLYVQFMLTGLFPIIKEDISWKSHFFIWVHGVPTNTQTVK